MICNLTYGIIIMVILCKCSSIITCHMVEVMFTIFNIILCGVQSLKESLQQTAETIKINIVEMECMPDYIHLLVECSPQHFIPDMIKVLKGNSARAIFIANPDLKKQLWGGHLWNPSYFIATVSDNTRKQVQEYIASQKTRN